MNDDLAEKELIDDALEAMYDLSSNEIEESLPSELPLYSSLSAEAWRYKDEVLLAKGGAKEVYKAFDPKTNRYAAIAKLHKDSSEVLYEPFLREARLTAFLEHPNIISIYDIGLDQNARPFFSMELKMGQGLDKLIQVEHTKQQQGLAEESLRSLVNIFLRICDAMAYAHSKEVLHLDLKPENIQVGHYGEVLVCDWGLGRILGSSDSDGGDFDRLLLNPDLLNNMTLNGEIKGTPGYMSPEQIQGQSVEKTKQADIYALGAILYTLLSNQSPALGAQSLDELLKRILDSGIAPPEQFKKVPRALSAICMKAMAPKPAERYKSVEDLSHDINVYLAGFSPLAEKASLVQELQLFCKRIINFVN